MSQRRLLAVALTAAALLFVSMPAAIAVTPTSTLPCNTSQTVQLNQLTLLENPTCAYPNASIDVDGTGRAFAVPPLGLSVAFTELLMDGSKSSKDVVVLRDTSGQLAVQTSAGLFGTETAKALFQTAQVTGAAALADQSSSSGTPTASSNPATTPTLYAGSNGCSNSAYTKAGWKWTTSVDWQYNASSQPSTNSLSIMQNAAARWTGIITACNQTYSSGASQQFQSQTTARPQVGADGSCGSFDTQNIIGWGVNNSANNLATTCTWYSTSDGRAYGSDQSYNSNQPWYTGGSCSAQYDVESVAVHEWGHTYGLTHVDQSTGQVMVPAMGYCQTEYRSLGSGDAAGITNLYPTS